MKGKEINGMVIGGKYIMSDYNSYFYSYGDGTLYKRYPIRTFEGWDYEEVEVGIFPTYEEAVEWVEEKDATCYG